jgi:hypothetical protein
VPLHTLWCCLRQRHVTRVSNMEQEVVAVACPDFELSTAVCELKTNAIGEEVLLAFDDAARRRPASGRPVRCTLA